MGSVTERDNQFKEFLSGFFYDAFRVVGVTMPATNAFERLREVGAKMAATIEHMAEKKSIQVIKKLQAAVSEAFKKTEEELQKMHQFILNNRGDIDDLIKETKRLRDIIEGQKSAVVSQKIKVLTPKDNNSKEFRKVVKEDLQCSCSHNPGNFKKGGSCWDCHMEKNSNRR